MVLVNIILTVTKKEQGGIKEKERGMNGEAKMETERKKTTENENKEGKTKITANKHEEHQREGKINSDNMYNG